MELILTKDFVSQYESWFKSQKEVANKIRQMIDGIKGNPFITIGKLEKLKYCENVYSRRITKKDRLVYSVDNNTIVLISCKGHYE